MLVRLSSAGRDLCTVEIWDKKVPSAAEALRRHGPITSILQHGKIVGDLVFFSLPFVLPPENAFPLQEIVRARRRDLGSAAGAVCFYSSRQQICIYYGDDLCDEPFEISYIGEIVAGGMDMRLAALECWSHPGQRITLTVQSSDALPRNPREIAPRSRS